MLEQAVVPPRFTTVSIAHEPVAQRPVKSKASETQKELGKLRIENLHLRKKVETLEAKTRQFMDDLVKDSEQNLFQRNFADDRVI